MARTPAMGQRSQLRQAVLQAARSAPGTRIADLQLRVDDQPIPVSTARQVATELTEDGLLKARIIGGSADQPRPVRVKQITPIGRRYLKLIGESQLR